MKKILTLFILCCVALLMFAGCKKKENTETMNNVTPAVTATSAPMSTPTSVPTAMPTVTPTVAPTAVPTAAPTAVPTAAPTVAPTSAPTMAAQLYKDGVYEVQTPVDGEKYYVKATVTIKGGKITTADWTIYDAGNGDVPFDGDYYKVFEKLNADAVYVQQAKDDWAGSRGYADDLIKTQDLTKVDAVSGATWANREFKMVIKLALDKAKAK